MAAKSENPAISPVPAPAASARMVTEAAPTPVPAVVTPTPAKASAKAKAVVPPPAPPPPDNRTPEELEAVFSDFLASSPAPSATTPTLTEEAVPPNPDTTETPTLEEEPQAEPTEPSEPEGDAGPEWLVNALDTVPEGALPSWLPARLLKIAKHDEARNAEIKTLKEALAAQAAPAAVPPVVAESSPADPLAAVTSESQLQQAVANAAAWEEWCELNPEGGELTPGKEESFLDAEAVRANRIAARRILRAEPAKREWLKQFQATSNLVLKDSPALADKASADYATALDLLSRPLAARPDYMQVVADYLAGKREREDRARGVQKVTLNKPAASVAAARTPAPAVGTVPPVRAAGAREDINTLRTRASSGDEQASNRLATMFLEPAGA